MPLDPDAQAVIDAMLQAFPGGLHAAGIDEARARLAAGAKLAPPGPEVTRVEDRVVTRGELSVPVRVYRPSLEPGLPALIWLHGGAFALGSVDGADATARELAAGAGLVVISVDYRLAPEHKFPAGLEDCYAVACWAAADAGALGVDPARIAIGGDSAGGTLAAATCLLARDRGQPGLAFQLLVYPTTLMRVSSYEYVADPMLSTSMMSFFWNAYARSDADFGNPYCAPMAADSLAGLPPAFVVIAEVDPTRGDQEAYASRLAASGVLTTCKLYPGVPHGFFSMTQALAQGRQAMADATRMLRGQLASLPQGAQQQVHQ
jgi:acetyl esterase